LIVLHKPNLMYIVPTRTMFELQTVIFEGALGWDQTVAGKCFAEKFAVGKFDAVY
jgi:hypothetical protein